MEIKAITAIGKQNDHFCRVLVIRCSLSAGYSDLESIPGDEIPKNLWGTQGAEALSSA